MRGRVLVSALALAAVAAAGCGGGHGARSAGGRQQGDGPAPIQLATYTCWFWRTAGARERATVVRELRRFYGLPVAGRAGPQAYGSVLSDGAAHALFDGYCRQPYAQHFTLYKLYARAAGFAGTAP